MLIHSIVPSLLQAAIRLSSPQLNSSILYSCILQLHVSGTLLFHLDIDMYHVSTVQIHTDVQMYSCTLLQLLGGTATFRTRIPYPDTVLGHTKSSTQYRYRT